MDYVTSLYYIPDVTSRWSRSSLFSLQTSSGRPGQSDCYIGRRGPLVGSQEGQIGTARGRVFCEWSWTWTDVELGRRCFCK